MMVREYKLLHVTYYVSALGFASINGHVALVKSLLKDGNADVNKKNAYTQTALMLASNEGQAEVVHTLF